MGAITYHNINGKIIVTIDYDDYLGRREEDPESKEIYKQLSKLARKWMKGKRVVLANGLTPKFFEKSCLSRPEICDNIGRR